MSTTAAAGQAIRMDVAPLSQMLWKQTRATLLNRLRVPAFTFFSIFMPLMFFFFSLQVASGLALYWVVSNLYTFVQQYFAMGWGTLPFLDGSCVNEFRKSFRF